MQATFYTRREVIGATMIVIVMTRWAVADLVGYVKDRARKDPAADQYREIRIPALSETEEEAEGETPDALGRTVPGRSYWPGVVSEGAAPKHPRKQHGTDLGRHVWTAAARRGR